MGAGAIVTTKDPCDVSWKGTIMKMNLPFPRLLNASVV